MSQQSLTELEVSKRRSSTTRLVLRLLIGDGTSTYTLIQLHCGTASISVCWLKRAGWRGNPGVASLRIRTMSTGISSWGWGTRVGKRKYVALVLNRTTVLLTTFVEKLSTFS